MAAHRKSREKPYVQGSVFYVPLTQGKWAKVDEAVSQEVMQHAWYFSKEGYARGDFDGIRWLLHHYVLNIADLNQPGEVDHINGDPLDNRLKNLRWVTHSENQRNRRIQGNNTSGFRGVSRVGFSVWHSRIKRNGKTRNLGYYTSPIVAARAYDAAVLGDPHSRPNFRST